VRVRVGEDENIIEKDIKLKQNGAILQGSVIFTESEIGNLPPFSDVTLKSV